MDTNLKAASLAATVAALEGVNRASESQSSVEDLIQGIKSPDGAVSGPAWQGAADCGAAAVRPLGELMAEPDFEVARSAKRALYRIVHHVGRPGAEAEAQAVEAALIPLLKHEAAKVRREVLWMLSEIGSDGAVAPMAALLSDQETREDARCALARLPSKAAVTALNSAFQSAPEDFRFALVDALWKRGVQIEGYPSQKLTPTRHTTVTTLSPNGAAEPPKPEAK